MHGALKNRASSMLEHQKLTLDGHFSSSRMLRCNTSNRYAENILDFHKMFFLGLSLQTFRPVDFQMGDEIFRRMIFMTGHKGQSVPSARYTFLLSFAFIR